MGQQAGVENATTPETIATAAADKEGESANFISSLGTLCIVCCRMRDSNRCSNLYLSYASGEMRGIRQTP
jgi:hypothetical protein